MYSWKLNYKHEESPVDWNLMSIFIKVEFEGHEMADILDVNSFFMMIESEGYIPLFTCTCGFFGCGGYYINVSHTTDGIVLKNRYKPADSASENDLVEIFEFVLSWEDFYIIASDVYDNICSLNKQYPSYRVCVGAYGAELVSGLSQYEELLGILRGRYDE